MANVLNTLKHYCSMWNCCLSQLWFGGTVWWWTLFAPKSFLEVCFLRRWTAGAALTIVSMTGPVSLRLFAAHKRSSVWVISFGKNKIWLTQEAGCNYGNRLSYVVPQRALWTSAYSNTADLSSPQTKRALSVQLFREPRQRATSRHRAAASPCVTRGGLRCQLH